MCLLVLAWKIHPRYRLIVAANRDEFHDRPSAALGWWNDEPRILAGRDLRGHGTWMGVARSGRFGIVTNFRDLEQPPVADAPSRGELIPQYLASDTPATAFVDDLRGRASRYAGFNLLIGNPQALLYFTNRNGDGARALEPGLYGLSNHWLDSPWPKLRRTREGLTRLLAAGSVESEALFALLADRKPADPDETPVTGLPPEWERALSSPFVLHERYGTRSSTVLLAGHDGRTVVQERRFDATGAMTGATRFEFVAPEEPVDVGDEPVPAEREVPRLHIVDATPE
jgi:uncharacterized protein with NRDE domain